MSRMFVVALLTILVSLSLGCCSMTPPPGSDSGISEDGTEMTLNDTRDGGDAVNESTVVPGGSIGIKK